MDKNSGRGRSSPPPSALRDPQSKAPAGSRKPKAKVASPKKRKDKRGTPKGKGTVKRPNGSRIGNPPFVATDEQRIRVEAMISAGAQHWFVAEDLGIDKRTLERHFAPELSEGKHRA